LQAAFRLLSGGLRLAARHRFVPEPGFERDPRGFLLSQLSLKRLSRNALRPSCLLCFIAAIAVKVGLRPVDVGGFDRDRPIAPPRLVVGLLVDAERAAGPVRSMGYA